MLEEIKKVVPTKVKRVIKKQVSSNGQVKVSKVKNPNLILTDIFVDSDKVILTIKENQPFNVTRLGYLVTVENKIYELPFVQKENQIVLKQEDLKNVDI